MMWPARLTEDEKIQTGIVIITPLGSQRAELGKGGSAEPPGQGGSSVLARSGLFRSQPSCFWTSEALVWQRGVSAWQP